MLELSEMTSEMFNTYFDARVQIASQILHCKLQSKQMNYSRKDRGWGGWNSLLPLVDLQQFSAKQFLSIGLELMRMNCAWLEGTFVRSKAFGCLWVKKPTRYTVGESFRLNEGNVTYCRFHIHWSPDLKFHHVFIKFLNPTFFSHAP